MIQSATGAARCVRRAKGWLRRIRNGWYQPLWNRGIVVKEMYSVFYQSMTDKEKNEERRLVPLEDAYVYNGRFESIQDLLQKNDNAKHSMLVEDRLRTYGFDTRFESVTKTNLENWMVIQGTSQARLNIQQIENSQSSLTDTSLDVRVNHDSPSMFEPSLRQAYVVIYYDVYRKSDRQHVILESEKSIVEFPQVPVRSILRDPLKALLEGTYLKIQCFFFDAYCQTPAVYLDARLISAWFGPNKNGYKNNSYELSCEDLYIYVYLYCKGILKNKYWKKSIRSVFSNTKIVSRKRWYLVIEQRCGIDMSKVGKRAVIPDVRQSFLQFLTKFFQPMITEPHE